MTARKVRQVLGAVFFGGLIGACLMAIAVIRSPHGHADVYQDKQFLYAESQVAEVLDGPGLILHAKEGCAIAMVEHNPHRIADIMWTFSPSLTFNEITQVAYVAAEFYCPSVLYGGTVV